MPSVIDLDRGVTMHKIVKFVGVNKFEADQAFGGMCIYMYKDEPGVYYDDHGRKVPEALAEKAGFPIKEHAKQRAIREATAKFKEQMAAQLRVGDEELTVIKAAGDWQVLRLPLGRAKIVDRETGESVTPTVMTEADALMLLDQLTGAKSETDAAVREAKAQNRKPPTEDA